MSASEQEQQPLLPLEEVESTPVYPIIHLIRRDIMHFIDTPLTYEAMSAPDLTYTLVRPLEEKYNTIQREGNKSIVFCLLLNRVHFLRDKSITTSTLSRSRAALCEILAIKTLRDYGSSMLDLTRALTTSWPTYSGAGERIIALATNDRGDLEDRVGNAIEMAILGGAKRFISSNSCQKVINGIWTGKCVYQAEGNHTILSDTYKRTPVHFYDPHKAPLLDHYRLKVPAIRSVLEYLNFMILFILFLFAIELNDLHNLNTSEVVFLIYGLGFTLEKFAAMQEHGVKVYFTGTWNGFDIALVTAYCVYAILRLCGVYYHNDWAKEMGIDCLALVACLMFPRLAFVTLKNNLMVLALRAMMMQFVVLMVIAAWCFGGFLYALWILSRTGPQYTVGTIAWWMLDLWFGLDASGFDKATQFHPYFGPILMVAYACLSNTLLLTVLVSILSYPFSTINEDAAAEAMFRKAVSTIEGVKADPLFSYQPPINVIALLIMLPASYVLSPRWFHKLNVFMIRLTNFPILLLIAWYERSRKASDASNFYDTITAAIERLYDSLPKGIKRQMSFFEGFVGSENEIDAIFEVAEGAENDPTQIETTEVAHATSSEAPQRHVLRSPPSPVGHSSTHGRQITNKGSSSAPPAIPVSNVRRRVNSIFTRGVDVAQSFSSPLAQIFQPLIVDDDGVGSSGDSEIQASGVSYGPASRRRLSPRRGPGANDTAGGTVAQIRGDYEHRASSESPFELTEDDVQSVVSFPHLPDSEKTPNVATQAVRDAELVGGNLLINQLAEMEKRQIRMEKLLMKLSQSQGSCAFK